MFQLATCKRQKMVCSLRANHFYLYSSSIMYNKSSVSTEFTSLEGYIRFGIARVMSSVETEEKRD